MADGGSVAHRLWRLIAIVSVLCSCGAAPRQNQPLVPAMPVIELLSFADCPNTPVLRAARGNAWALPGRGWTFTETNQERLPESDIRRGYPTPTVLVNQRDLFGLPEPTTTSLSCRVYPGGVPDATAVAAQLDRVLTR